MIPRKYFVLMLGLAIVVVIYVKFSYTSFAYYKNWFWNPVKRCSITEEETKQLLNLTLDVHNVLDDDLGIPHWLMYGSIWGARRLNGPLPWDNDVDIGFHGEGKFSKLSLREFFAPFKMKGMTVVNKWIQSGTIKIKRPGLNLTVDLFAFYNYNGMMKRTGLESWLFPINYNYYHTFPAWTVEPPLPKTRFGNFEIGIPKGGLKILKHLYRDSWLKVDAPEKCKKKENIQID